MFFSHRKALLEALEAEFIIAHPDPICQEKNQKNLLKFYFPETKMPAQSVVKMKLKIFFFKKSIDKFVKIAYNIINEGQSWKITYLVRGKQLKNKHHQKLPFFFKKKIKKSIDNSRNLCYNKYNKRDKQRRLKTMTIKEFKENVVNQYAEKKYVSAIIPEELRHCIYDVVDELIEEGYQKVSVDWDRFYIRGF